MASGRCNTDDAGKIGMINDLCMDLLVAGADTSTQTVSWTLLLANRPEVQAKVREELDRVIGPDALPTVDDRTRLPYTFACLAGPCAIAPSAPWRCRTKPRRTPKSAGTWRRRERRCWGTSMCRLL